MTLEGQILLASFIAGSLGTFFLFAIAAYVSRRARRFQIKDDRYQYKVVSRKRPGE